MKFRHRDAPNAAAGSVSFGVRDSVPIDEDDAFEVDEGREDFEDVYDRLVEAGHDPLDSDTDDDTENDGDGAGDSDPPQASDFTEDELVEMDRSALRPIAAHYDDVDGNASGDELTEALIQKRREEVDDDGA